VSFVQASPCMQLHVYVLPLLRQRPLFCAHGFDEHGSIKVDVVVVVDVEDVVVVDVVA